MAKPKTDKIAAARLVGCAALLLFCLAANFYITKTFFVSRFLEGDSAGEIGLARTIYETGGLFFSDNWYYATELRFLHNHLIMLPLFSLLNSAVGVHLASTAIVQVLMAASAVFLVRSLQMEWWKALLAGAVTISPYSIEIMYINLVLNGYSTAIALTFLWLGLLFRLQRMQGGRKRWMLLAGLSALSVLLGMCGIRHAITLIAPACLAGLCMVVRRFDADLRAGQHAAPRALLQKQPYTLLPALGLGFLGYAAGFIIFEKILCRLYTVGDMTGLVFSSTTDIFTKLRNTPAALADLLFPLYEVKVLSLQGVLLALRAVYAIAVVACGIYLLAKRHRYSFAQQFFILFSWAALFVGILSVALTSDYHTGADTLAIRYLIPSVMPLLLLPLAVLSQPRVGFTKRLACLVLLPAVLLINGFTTYSTLRDKPQYGIQVATQMPMLQDVGAWLLENGYTAGYASFHYAGTLGVLSNYELDVVGVYYDDAGFTGRKWLERKDYARIHGQGSYFLIATVEEYEWFYSNVKDFTVIREDGVFVVMDTNGEALA